MSVRGGNQARMVIVYQRSVFHRVEEILSRFRVEKLPKSSVVVRERVVASDAELVVLDYLVARGGAIGEVVSPWAIVGGIIERIQESQRSLIRCHDRCNVIPGNWITDQLAIYRPGTIGIVKLANYNWPAECIEYR